MLTIDPTSFHLVNVADTCAVWNVLASKRMYAAACEAGCNFCITEFVFYECFSKGKRVPTPEQEELRRRLSAAQKKDAFRLVSCDVEDLQTIAMLEHRQGLGKGELSSIAFAMKIGQAFITDDFKAQKLSKGSGCAHTQSTRHLFAWLVFHNRLTDTEKAVVIGQLRAMERGMERHFEKAYMTASEFRLMANGFQGGLSQSSQA